MVQRSKKLAFIKSGGVNNNQYTRMKGFTEFTVNSNPKEYTRKYIDEDAERSAVVSYQPTISYKFDYDGESDVHKIFLNVSEFELTGEESVCTIAIVDMEMSDDEGIGYFTTVREFYIIPETEGDDTDVYTYSGTLKAAGKKKMGYATSDDNWETITFVNAI